MAQRSWKILIAGREIDVRLLEYRPATDRSEGLLKFSADGKEVEFTFEPAGKVFLLRTGTEAFTAIALKTRGGTFASARGYGTVMIRQEAKGIRADKKPSLTPPMPSVVVKVAVEPGERVEKNQQLVVLSAMKLETVIRAPSDGIVESVLVRAGDSVRAGQQLVVFREVGND